MSAMQKVYATMAFTYAAVLVVSVWVGLNDLPVAKNLRADEVDNIAMGQARRR